MNNEIQSKLRVLIRDLLDMPAGSVRPADINQPTEGDDYAIMQVSDMNNIGWTGESIDAYQTGIATITLDFMGNNAGTYARNLALAMKTFYATNELLKMNLGFMNCGNAINLSAAELERVKRFRVKLMLSYSFTYDRPKIVADAHGLINEVNINLISEP